jgi:dGTPase
MKSIALPQNCELAKRLHEDELHPDDPRTAFQHDKDRILYSTAFRRLQYKTQVYVIHEGDLYRTRMTHTLEVAQISRALALRLEADADLAEAIALAHDLGHSPFGHAGGETLKELASNYGVSFEHNVQSYRTVSNLEERYSSFSGLNLTRASLEGILRHCTFFDDPADIKSCIPDELRKEVEVHWQSPQPSAEAQIVNIADMIAYAAHDIEDALSVGLIERGVFEKRIEEEGILFLRDILAKELPQKIIEYEKRSSESSDVSIRKVRERIMARLIVDKLIRETVRQSAKNIEILYSRDGDLWANIRDNKLATVALSDSIEGQVRSLINDVLFNSVYQEPRVVFMMEKGKRILELLFRFFAEQPKALPDVTQARLQDYFRMSKKQQKGKRGKRILGQVVIDYISGMTDKYAMDMYDLITQAYQKVL